MITLIIISVYLANIFINRWLNKYLHENLGEPIIPYIWFIPVIPVVFLSYHSLIFYFRDSGNNKLYRWFTGKHWEKDPSWKHFYMYDTNTYESGKNYLYLANNDETTEFVGYLNTQGKVVSHRRIDGKIPIQYKNSQITHYKET